MAERTDTSRHASVGKVPMKEPDFPNLRKMEQEDLELHAEKAVEMGMDPKDAIRHAKEDHQHWSPGDVEKKPHQDE